MINRAKWREDLKPRLPKTKWKQPEHDDGWKDLVCDLIDALDKTGVPYTIDQIKEKWGTLCVYVNATKKHINSKDFFRLIKEAEERSGTICELCGNQGETGSAMRVKTLCSTCLGKEDTLISVSWLIRRSGIQEE